MPSRWTPPDSWTRITTLDVHTAGEPLRIITGGFPSIPGDSILAKRRYARENLDHLRTTLMWEPRGHADMYGAILTDPVTPDGDAGVLFLHNEGYSTMCGHGIIGLAMAGVEAGLFPLPPGSGSRGEDPEDLVLRLDTPAGRVTASTHFAVDDAGGRSIREASFLNVPSFVVAMDHPVQVPGVGEVGVDVAFGGAFYAFCAAEALGVGLEGENVPQLIEVGMRVKKAVMEALPLRHPQDPDLSFLYGTIIVGAARNPAHHSRNVCVFADGEVDRSPTGTGVSARAALHHARGELRTGEPFTVESILGTTFTGEVVSSTRSGQYEAVVPRISGTSHIVGRSEFLLDPTDALRHGFILR